MGDYYRARDRWVNYNRDYDLRRDAYYRMETEDGQGLLVYCDRILANTDQKAEDTAWEELAENIGEFTEDVYQTSPVREILYAGGSFNGLSREEERRLRDLEESRKKKVWVNIRYQNPEIVYGRIKTVSGESWYTGFMIDRRSGESVDICELISREEMLRICRDGMRDVLHRPFTGEEAEKYLKWIEEGYEYSNNHTPRSVYEERGLNVKFGMNEWGIVITFDVDDDWRVVYLDKEYFMDTPLWKYWEAAVPW